jgi:flagellar motor switch protein FliG
MAEAISSKPIRLSDVEKSAVVLLSIGEEAAAQDMKHMTQLEINLLSLAMARISHVSKTEVTTVFQEFVDLMLEEIPISIGGESYVHDVLEQALGPEKAERLATRLSQGDYFAGVEAVQLQDPRVLAELIKSEQPQIIAAIFAYMEPEQADALIQHLPPEIVELLVPRLATQVRPPGGGVSIAARILNRIDAERAEAVLEQISAVDAELADVIKAEASTNGLFIFEDLEQLDDRSLQMLLRSINQRLLASALSNANPILLQKITRNLSRRSAEMLREEIFARDPVAVDEIDAARSEIVATAKRLERDGTIILPTSVGALVT